MHIYVIKNVLLWLWLMKFWGYYTTNQFNSLNVSSGCSIGREKSLFIRKPFQIPIEHIVLTYLTSRHIVSERGFVVRGLCSPTHKAAIDSHLTWQRWICVSWEQEAHKIQWNVWNSSCSYILRWHWHCNQGKWHYALEYYYNYEKKYFGYMHYINAFMMDKMVDKLMCSIALKNSLN